MIVDGRIITATKWWQKNSVALHISQVI